MIGIDMGLKAFAITSDGMEYPNHKHLTKSQKKLAKLQRQLSRKSKGSNRREKARVKLARSISDASWGELRRQLEYKAGWYGKQLVTVDRSIQSAMLRLRRSMARHKGFVRARVGLSRLRHCP